MTNTQNIEDFINKYMQAIAEGDAASAEDILHQARQSHPNSAALLTLAAAQAMHQGHSDHAEALLTEALQSDPGLNIARFQLGLVQFTNGRMQTAFLTWKPLDDLPENHYLLYFKRAFAALAIDAYDDMFVLVERGIAANHENSPLNDDMRMLAANVKAMRNQPVEQTEEPAESAAFMALATYKQNQ